MLVALRGVGIGALISQGTIHVVEDATLWVLVSDSSWGIREF